MFVTYGYDYYYLFYSKCIFIVNYGSKVMAQRREPTEAGVSSHPFI